MGDNSINWDGIRIWDDKPKDFQMKIVSKNLFE